MILTLSGCATTVPLLQLAPGAEEVLVAKSDPGDNYRIVGPVSGIDGEGCGGFGYKGTYERAITSLRNRTHQMGGDYAQIISLSEPHLAGDCFKNSYTVRATAYRKTRSKPSPILIEDTGEEKLTKKLRELKKLHDDGILTSEEYDAQKERLLNEGF